MSRFCEECGTPLEPNENFCSNCGAKVIRDEPPQPTYTPPVNQPSPQPTYTPPVNQASTQPTYTPPKSTPVESTSQPAENNMGKFLALIGILVLIGVVTYFATNRQSDEALGELYIGMSKDEVDRKFVKISQERDRSYSYENGKFRVKFDSNNKVDFIDCSNETFNTKKGIHVGSTFDEVKRAYGNNYQFVNGVRYLYTLGDSLLVFFVSKETNRVNSITLETSEETRLGGFYLGMSKDEADRWHGAGTPLENEGYSYADGTFWLKFDSNNKAERILFRGDWVSTKRGIRIGSTLDEVKRAYGNGYQFDDTTFGETPAYIYTLGNSQLFFFMDKATNRVSAIRLDTFKR